MASRHRGVDLRSIAAALLFATACAPGAFEAPADYAFDVGDAVYWMASDTGDPGTDGSIIVLTSDRDDLCDSLERGSFEGEHALLGFQAFSGSSDQAANTGTYEVGGTTRRAIVRRMQSDGSCRMPTGMAEATSGTLTIDQAPGATNDDVEGSFTGRMGDAEVTARFSASFCEAGTKALNGQVRTLRFRSCAEGQ